MVRLKMRREQCISVLEYRRQRWFDLLQACGSMEIVQWEILHDDYIIANDWTGLFETVVAFEARCHLEALAQFEHVECYLKDEELLCLTTANAPAHEARSSCC